MEKLHFRLLNDEMLKTCRELIPLSRKMTETDDSLILDCFNKYSGAYLTADEIMSRTSHPLGLFNYGGAKSSKRP